MTLAPIRTRARNDVTPADTPRNLAQNPAQLCHNGAMRNTSNTSRSHRFDWLIFAAVTGAISLLIAVGVPIGCAASLMARYHGFIGELGESLVYAREHDTLELGIDGEKQEAQLGQAEWLYGIISDAGMGSPRSETPEGDPLIFGFGDGSVLQLYPAEINEPDGTTVAGTVICFTNKNGRLFAYDTDKLAFDKLVEGVRRAAN